MTIATITPIYTAIASARGGREGHAETADGKLGFDLDFPPALGGKGKGTNPEQLFALGYAACFNSALLHVARAKGVKLGDPRVTAKVTIGRDEQNLFGLSVALEVSIPDMPRAEAQALVEAAHKVCPYSRAVHDNVAVALSVV